MMNYMTDTLKKSRMPMKQAVTRLGLKAILKT